MNDLKIFSDSLIINNNKSYIDSLIKWIGNDKIEVKLLYRKSRDGTSYDTFHVIILVVNQINQPFFLI